MTEVVKASPNPRTEGRARLSRTLTAPVYIFVPQACGVHSVLTCVTCFQERHGKREEHFWRERWQHSCRLGEKEEGRERVRRGTQTGGVFQSLCQCPFTVAEGTTEQSLRLLICHDGSIFFTIYPPVFSFNTSCIAPFPL